MPFSPSADKNIDKKTILAKMQVYMEMFKNVQKKMNLRKAHKEYAHVFLARL